MKIIDSSGWLEYLANTKNAKNYANVIEDIENVLIPTIIIYEVFKKIINTKDENTALQIIAYMRQGQIVDIDFELSLAAARYSKEYNLPMADSLIYAIARKYNAELLTQDNDFRNLPNVKFFNKE